jgi:hypothetical protein
VHRKAADALRSRRGGIVLANLSIDFPAQRVRVGKHGPQVLAGHLHSSNGATGATRPLRQLRDLELHRGRLHAKKGAYLHQPAPATHTHMYTIHYLEHTQHLDAVVRRG